MVITFRQHNGRRVAQRILQALTGAACAAARWRIESS